MQAFLDAARLRYAGRLVRNGPAHLLGLIQQKAGDEWRAELVKSLHRMWIVLRSRLAELGNPTVDPLPWQRFMRERPVQWSQLIRRYLQATVDVEAQKEPQLVPSSGDELLCGICGRDFPNSKALKCHAIQKHGRRSQASAFVPGTRCPVCGTDYNSRLRAIVHLERGQGQCSAFMRSGQLQAMSPEDHERCILADRAERRAARAAGFDPLCGLPCQRLTAQPSGP